MIRMLLVPCLLLSATAADLRVVAITRSEQPIQRQFRLATPEQRSIHYVRGEYRRAEFGEMENGKFRIDFATIRHCPEELMLYLNFQQRQYHEEREPKGEPPTKVADKSGRSKIIFDVATVATGETRQFFGRTAQRYVTTIRMADPELSGSYGETVEDAWFIEDLPNPLSCERAGPRGMIVSFLRSGSKRELAPLIEHRFTGPTPRGLVVASTTKQRQRLTRHGKATETVVNRYEVIELSEETLNPALFNPPSGFDKVFLIH